MSTSYSSLLRSMPMYQAQLNRTAFRSFAPAAGVYSGAPRPPRPPPCAPPAPAPAPRPPWVGGAAGAAPPACAKAEDGSLIVRATAIATLVHIIPFREAMAISRYRLVVRVTRGYIHDLAVRPRNRLEESQRTPVPCRDELRGQRFAGLERIRADFGDPAIGERRGRAGREHPVGRRAVGVLHRDRHRSVRIHELDLGQRARDFLLRLHVVDAGEGMMRLERGTGHQTPADDDTSQSSPNHLCLREVVIGTRCHHTATEKKPDNRPPERRSVPRARAQIKGLIIAAFRVRIASIRAVSRLA